VEYIVKTHDGCDEEKALRTNNENLKVVKKAKLGSDAGLIGVVH